MTIVEPSVLRKTTPTLYRLWMNAIINNEILCKFRINQIINIKGNVETSRSVNENEKNKVSKQTIVIIKKY